MEYAAVRQLALPFQRSRQLTAHGSQDIVAHCQQQDIAVPDEVSAISIGRGMEPGSLLLCMFRCRTKDAFHSRRKS